jgi:outer membrane protein assembly factor BamB
MNIKKAEMALLTAFVLFLAPLAVYAGNGETKDTLGPNEKLGASEELKSINGRNTLVLQRDGNLVVYDSRGKPTWNSNTMESGAAECVMREDGNLLLNNASGKVVWETYTGGYKNARLVMQDDGNLVIYSGRGIAVWANGRTKDSLSKGENLLANEFIRSQNRKYTLALQADGNLVAYDSQGKAIWNSNTMGSGAAECVMQEDGNLLLKDRNGRVVWATNTDGYSNATLFIQDDGNVVLYKEKGDAFWSNGKINLDIKPDPPPADVPAAYNANTGDNEFDDALSNLNNVAHADLDNFMNKLSDTFGISRPWIENLVQRENIPPADVYMIARTASVTNRTIGTVENYYMDNRGQGWGVIAQRLGIKPGSREFHALKRDDTGLLSKGKNQGQKKKDKDKS